MLKFFSSDITNGFKSELLRGSKNNLFKVILYNIYFNFALLLKEFIQTKGHF